MSTNHNRIKVADLETNQPDKILSTNSSGELEFRDINSIKTDSYNGLDYSEEGKALDARQGKVLKDLIYTSAYAPHLEELIPNYFLPSETNNIILKGSFFTPTTTVAIEGQVINYVKFKSDNEIHVNLTTGLNEGMFDVTINNNQISKTYTDKLLINLGEVSYPTASSWSNFLSTPIISEDGSIKVSTSGITQGADWKIIPANEDFRIIAVSKESPFNPGYLFDAYNAGGTIQLISTTDNARKVWFMFRWFSALGGNVRVWNSFGEDSTDAKDTIAYGPPHGKVATIERKAGIWKFYVNNILIKSYTASINEELLIRFRVNNQEVTGIKYVKLAT
ncbi:hypothetical protein GCM10022422_17370 [Flavobacterium ginsengisoli]|uniref:IPT/TIG domain-containing protein n=1 Tax=Flavobacterium ginsengisoli TaxID=871694 RepID=A0ABP7FG61_9FLAO|nr:hypothetical protein [Flavobacterium ginsengisoli]